MSEKKYNIPGGTVCGEEYDSDFAAAPEFEKVRVGKLGVYYRDGFKMRLVPYSMMERCFIRVQDVRGRMCCGSAHFEYYRLIFIVDGKEVICDHISENEKITDETLAKIAETAPNVKIGVAKPEE